MELLTSICEANKRCAYSGAIYKRQKRIRNKCYDSLYPPSPKYKLSQMSQ